MSRALSATIASAVAQDATRPVYLIEFGFSTTVRIATWDQPITWGGYVWASSGAELQGLSSSGARLTLPNGTSDPWLAYVLNDQVRGETIAIYEHHYHATSSPQTDAVLVFSGIMDSVSIADKINIRIIESSQAKAFPALSADVPTFTRLLKAGSQIVWGNNTITVN